MPVALPTKPV